MKKRNKFKKDFPIFKTNKSLVYLDNAATSQTPKCVTDAMNEYYSTYRANIHRGAYWLSAEATKMYEEARQTVADFLNAKKNEIIFTSGTTQGLNGLAFSLSKNLTKKDNIVLTRMEHHANLIPWQEMRKQYGFEIRFIELNDYQLDLESAKKVIDENTKIVSFVHVSNVLGTINPAREIIKMAKKFNAITIVDAAQSVGHIEVDVKKLDCDYLVFSGHKIGGSTGIGVLYGKEKQLNILDPFLYGGGMINEVTYEKSTWAEVPFKFEAGTPNIAGAIGLAAALKYINKIGVEKIQKNEQELAKYALEKLSKIKELKIIGQDVKRTGVISFVLNGIHEHDIATILDDHDVAVRSGHHCAMPLMKYLGVNGTTRISFWIYNEKKDVDDLIFALKKVLKIFKV